MIQNLPTDIYWYLVIIDDKKRKLNGESFNEMLELVQEAEKIKFVILDYVDGAGKNGLIASLQDNLEKIYEMEYILKITKDIIQLDWGDFFMFKEYPTNWKNPKGEFYPYVISQTDITLRAVDDRYMYIYTKNKRIIDSIKTNHVIVSIKYDLLDNLDFPE